MLVQVFQEPDLAPFYCNTFGLNFLVGSGFVVIGVSPFEVALMRVMLFNFGYIIPLKCYM